eukprot:1874668-Amphidinium_carterae.2
MASLYGSIMCPSSTAMLHSTTLYWPASDDIIHCIFGASIPKHRQAPFKVLLRSARLYTSNAIYKDLNQWCAGIAA